MSQASQDASRLETDMNAAIPVQHTAQPELRALFTARKPSARTSPARRNVIGAGFAILLHGALLAVIVANVGTLSEPVTPPKPYMTVSLVAPAEPTPAPALRPQPVKVKESRPTPVVQPKAVAATKPVQQTLLTAAATAGNPVESTAPVTPASPAAPPAPSQVQDAPVAMVPPKFDAAYLSNPAPPYPTLSKRMGEEGRVLLKVHVGADGRPLEVSIAQSSGFPRLDESARETVLRNWRFVPARQGDKAIAGSVKVPVIYTLNSAS
jgi:periplasmic protein TonB